MWWKQYKRGLEGLGTTAACEIQFRVEKKKYNTAKNKSLKCICYIIHYKDMMNPLAGVIK